MWTPFAKVWFTDGKDDADISLIKVTLNSPYNWDIKNDKMISIIQMTASIITGSASNDGVERALKV